MHEAFLLPSGSSIGLEVVWQRPFLARGSTDPNNARKFGATFRDNDPTDSNRLYSALWREGEEKRSNSKRSTRLFSYQNLRARLSSLEFTEKGSPD